MSCHWAGHHHEQVSRLLDPDAPPGRHGTRLLLRRSTVPHSATMQPSSRGTPRPRAGRAGAGRAASVSLKPPGSCRGPSPGLSG
jgi:hypothetical protein